MRMEAVAIAHPNVALSKYWGKRQGEGNVPAVPSLSVTLEGLATRTRVSWRHDTSTDRIVLNGRPLDGPRAQRALAVLEHVRRAIGLSKVADVDSHNDFPTASGLASSASGFAALALAAVRAGGPGYGGGPDWDASRIADLARRGSASASRSLFGGFVELEDGVARQVAPKDHLPLAVLVCVTTEEQKPIGSTEGMRLTMDRSPYARAWLEEAPKLHAQLREALLRKDFVRVGELAEASAMAMHASAIAAGVVYWNGATVEALSTVRALRAAGMPVYATIDAGPHVKVLARLEDAARARAAMEASAGVLRVIEARPGDGARLE